MLNALARFIRDPRFVPACLVVGITLRLGVSVVFPITPTSDGAWYYARASELAVGLGYQESGHPTAFWPVGYPAILSALFYLFGPHIFVVVLLNLGASLVAMWGILLISNFVEEDMAVGKLSLLTYCLYPSHIAYVGASMTEPTYTALMLFAVFVLFRFAASWKLCVVAGLLFGVASLIKAQTLLFPLGALVALRCMPGRPGRLRWAGVAVALYLGLFAVVAPWSVRNCVVLKACVPVSTNGGVTLLGGAMDEADGHYFDIDKTATFKKLGVPFEERVERQVELDRNAKHYAFRWILAHPWRYLALMPVKAAILWAKDTDAFWWLEATYPDDYNVIRPLQWVNQVYYLVVLLLAAPYVYSATKSLVYPDVRARRRLIILLMPTFVTLVCLIFTGQPRFHYPAMPFLFIAAAATVVTKSRKFGALKSLALHRSAP